MFNNLLAFSWSTLVSDVTGMLTSLITFITENSFLVMLIGIPLILGLLFSLISFFRR